jgi:hypothetical protein
MRDEVLKQLAEQAQKESLIDKCLESRFQDLIGKSDKEVLEPLLMILDDMVYCSLAADLVVTIIDTLYRDAGGCDEIMDQIRKNNPDHYGDRLDLIKNIE